MQLENLPQDLIVEILRRLSFKDIIKCKFTCKSWQALFSNPTFLKYRLQLRLNYKQPAALNPIRRLLVYGKFLVPDDNGAITTITKRMLHVYNEEYSGTLELDLEHKREVKLYTCVMSSSFLELVLLGQFCSQFVCLCNPSTDEFLVLPKSFDDQDFRYILSIGLGRVESTKEYKVVRVVECSSQIICEVFTLGIDNHWRKVADPPYLISSIPSIFADGGVYMFDSYEGNSELLRFDIEREDWKVIPGPKISQGCPCYWIIREVDGFVCITYNSIWTVYMWVLEDYEQGTWGLKTSIDIDYNFQRFLSDSQGSTLILYPLSFDYRDNKMLFVSNEEYADDCINTSKLLSYDPITLHVEQLPNPYPTIYDLTATFFTESFESLF